MATCQQCHTKWTWKDTFSSMFTVKKFNNCPYCGNKQTVTRRSRNNLALIPSIVALVWLPLIAFGVPYSVIILIELVMSITAIGILPFFYEITDREEPMW